MTPIDASITEVLGQPDDVNQSDGAYLVDPDTSAPNNDSRLTLEMAETISDNLWVYSFATTLDLRFKLWVSENGTSYSEVMSPLSQVLWTFFENDNALIDISITGLAISNMCNSGHSQGTRLDIVICALSADGLQALHNAHAGPRCCRDACTCQRCTGSRRCLAVWLRPAWTLRSRQTPRLIQTVCLY